MKISNSAGPPPARDDLGILSSCGKADATPSPFTTDITKSAGSTFDSSEALLQSSSSSNAKSPMSAILRQIDFRDTASSIKSDLFEGMQSYSCSITPRSLMSEIERLIVTLVTMSKELLSEKRVDFDKVLEPLCGLHTVLVVCVSFRSLGGILSNELIQSIRGVLALVASRALSPYKVGNYRKSRLDPDESEALEKLHVILKLPISKVKAVAVQLERLIGVRNYVVSSTSSFSVHSAALMPGDSPQWRRLAVLYKLPCPTNSIVRFRSRFSFISNLQSPEPLSGTSFVPFAIRYLDSVGWVQSTSLFSNVLCLPSGSSCAFGGDGTFADPSIRLIPFSLPCLRSAKLCRQLWKISHQYSSTLYSTTGLLSSNALPSVTVNCDHPNFFILRELARQTNIMITELEDMFCVMTRQSDIKLEWLGYYCRILCLFIHLCLFLVSRRDEILAAIPVLSRYLTVVCQKIREDAQPMNNTSEKRQFDSASSCDECQRFSRVNADIEDAVIDLEPIITLPKKSSTVQSKPSPNHPASQDTSSMPCGLLLCDIVHFLSIQTILASLPTTAPMILWALMCILEAQPAAPDIVRAFHAAQSPTSAQYSAYSSRHEVDHAAVVSWLKACALEGARIFELRLGAAVLGYDHAGVVNPLGSLPTAEPTGLFSGATTNRCTADSTSQLRSSNQASIGASSVSSTGSSTHFFSASGDSIMHKPAPYSGLLVGNWGEGIMSSGNHPQRCEAFTRMAVIVWKTLCLRLFDLELNSVYNDTSDLIQLILSRFRNDESKWAACICTVLGDIMLNCVEDGGISVPLLAGDVGSNEETLSCAFAQTIHELIQTDEEADVLATINAHQGALEVYKKQLCVLSDSSHLLLQTSNSNTVDIRTLQEQFRLHCEQLTALINGPIARHSNFLKTSMDRFDSINSELVKLGGLFNTHQVASMNQICELKKQVANSELQMRGVTTWTGRLQEWWKDREGIVGRVEEVKARADELSIQSKKHELMLGTEKEKIMVFAQKTEAGIGGLQESVKSQTDRLELMEKKQSEQDALLSSLVANVEEVKSTIKNSEAVIMDELRQHSETYVGLLEVLRKEQRTGEENLRMMMREELKKEEEKRDAMFEELHSNSREAICRVESELELEIGLVKEHLDRLKELVLKELENESRRRQNLEVELSDEMKTRSMESEENYLNRVETLKNDLQTINEHLSMIKTIVFQRADELQSDMERLTRDAGDSYSRTQEDLLNLNNEMIKLNDQLMQSNRENELIMDSTFGDIKRCIYLETQRIEDKLNSTITKVHADHHHRTKQNKLHLWGKNNAAKQPSSSSASSPSPSIWTHKDTTLQLNQNNSNSNNNNIVSTSSSHLVIDVFRDDNQSNDTSSQESSGWPDNQQAILSAKNQEPPSRTANQWSHRHQFIQPDAEQQQLAHSISSSSSSSVTNLIKPHFRFKSHPKQLDNVNSADSDVVRYSELLGSRKGHVIIFNEQDTPNQATSADVLSVTTSLKDVRTVESCVHSSQTINGPSPDSQHLHQDDRVGPTTISKRYLFGGCIGAIR